MREDLAGKVAVVTGAAQGIGGEILRAFPGASMWALDIDEARVEALARQTSERGAILSEQGARGRGTATAP